MLLELLLRLLDPTLTSLPAKPILCSLNSLLLLEFNSESESLHKGEWYLNLCASALNLDSLVILAKTCSIFSNKIEQNVGIWDNSLRGDVETRPTLLSSLNWIELDVKVCYVIASTKSLYSNFLTFLFQININLEYIFNHFFK